jgi:hypothetical protein
MESSHRSDNFAVHLERIQYQASRIADNQNFDELPEARKKTIRYQGLKLLIEIIKFLNSILTYFNDGFAGNLSSVRDTLTASPRSGNCAKPSEIRRCCPKIEYCHCRI